MKYNIRLEFIVNSIDFLDVKIKASSKKEAIELAIEEYHNGTLDLAEMYASDYYESKLITNTKDFMVEEYE